MVPVSYTHLDVYKRQGYAALLESKQELMDENKDLRKKLGSLELLLAQLRDVQQENQRLRDLLEFKEQSAGEYKGAEMCIRDR